MSDSSKDSNSLPTVSKSQNSDKNANSDQGHKGKATPTGSPKGWLTVLFSPRGKGSDFKTSTSLQAIFNKKKRLANAVYIFLAIDILLFITFILLWIYL